MTSQELPAVLRRVAHLAQRQLGDEVVVMDLRAGRLYGFNTAGGDLLERLKGGMPLAEARAAIAGAGPDETEPDSFLCRLVELGLVSEAADAAESGKGAAKPTPSLAMPPRLLWQEEAARVTNQTSPPQAITNPQCQP